MTITKVADLKKNLAELQDRHTNQKATSLGKARSDDSFKSGFWV